VALLTKNAEVGRRRVLIVKPSLLPPGGGETVAAWMIEALKDAYDVALVSWTRPDFKRVNEAYATSIRDEDVDMYTVARPIRLAIDCVPTRAALLKGSVLVRLARRVSRPSDLLISAENEADFGRRAIQYVHYPRQLRPRSREDMRWYHGPEALLDLYFAFCDRLTGFSLDGVRRNLSLANSEWTAVRTRDFRPGTEVVVLPPPVYGGFPDVPWDRRANGFVCVGRFAPEKELEKVVAILDDVRKQVPDVELHLVGGRKSRAYYRRVTQLVRRHHPWVHLHEDLSWHDLRTMIASQRYGIHGMREEHFGIAPAEMVRGGCIVFVPDGGGQVEIVGRDDRLLYATHADAVKKIVTVMTDAREQASLRAFLYARADLFSADRFVGTFRRLVAAFEARERRGGR
jgi:glycosyltransferase involved in cell wall biosynthesis